jgi:predicted secreted Zn-dependent protease
MRDLMRALALGTTLVASLLVAPQAIAQDAAVTGQHVAGTICCLSFSAVGYQEIGKKGPHVGIT